MILRALATLACLISVADGKLQAGSLRVGGPKKDNKWKYLSKFGYDIGTGTYKVRLQLHRPGKIANPGKVTLEAYLDEDWDEVEAIEDPCQRKAKAKTVQDVWVDKDGGWGEWVPGTRQQSVRPHIWYFAISDCDQALMNYTIRIKFEFEALQADGSHFSVEMEWMSAVNSLALLIFTMFIYAFVQKLIPFARSAGHIHPVIWTLAVAMLLQYIAQIFHTLHLWLYSYDGQGAKALEVLSEILFMLSQVLQTSLLILIGLGYTLLQSKIGELDLMIPMCFMIAVLHIMLVGFGKIKDDAACKYHENEGVVGWIVLSLRLLLYAWFMWACQSTAAEGGMKLRTFLNSFRAAGTIYFMTFPVLFLVVRNFAPYLQHGIMSTSLIIMQMGSNIWLATLFLSRSSSYLQVSSLNSSDLPGGCRVGIMKEE